MSRGSLTHWLRSIALLRFPETWRFLGERRLEMMLLDSIRMANPGTKLAADLQLVAFEPDRLLLGAGAAIGGGTVLAFGDRLNGFGRIEIGADTWIGQYNNLRACGGGDIRIGAGCLISQFCTLVGSNHAVARQRPIREQGPNRERLGVSLADDVWLGAGVSVMPGVSLGTGSVIGASSVVTVAVPEFEIWAGVPARKIGERN